MMTISERGLALIMAFEGFFARAYLCPAGVRTQGYGHTAAAGGEPLGGAWDKDKARRVLADDLSRLYEPGVRAMLKRQPTQGQYDALVSFAFNCGLAALKGSSVLKYFNRGEHAQAAGSFSLWVKGGGKTLPGLVRRRASEALLYQGVPDFDFDGRADKPLYGVMPQQVQPAREKIAASRTVQGGVVACGSGSTIGDVRVAAWRGQTIGAVTGTLKDWAGNTLPTS